MITSNLILNAVAGALGLGSSRPTTPSVDLTHSLPSAIALDGVRIVDNEQGIFPVSISDFLSRIRDKTPSEPTLIIQPQLLVDGGSSGLSGDFKFTGTDNFGGPGQYGTHNIVALEVTIRPFNGIMLNDANFRISVTNAGVSMPIYDRSYTLQLSSGINTPAKFLIFFGRRRVSNVGPNAGTIGAGGLIQTNADNCLIALQRHPTSPDSIVITSTQVANGPVRATFQPIMANSNGYSYLVSLFELLAHEKGLVK